MTVQELSVLHRRYIDVSNRFRAAWTFHQYIQGLQKLFSDQLDANPVLGRNMAEFQAIYAELKSLSQKLNASEAANVRSELEAIEIHLRTLVTVLLGEDAKISPSLCRQFFQRVKNYDEKILTQLVKFYILTQDGDAWQRDRLDKVDFLITKLAEESEAGSGPVMLRPYAELRELFAGLWSMLGFRPVTEKEVEARQRSLEQIRLQVAEASDFDKLNDLALVRRHRELKESLGSLFLQPDLLMAAVETNVAIKNAIRNLYQREEGTIVAEYQRVFELERTAPVDAELDVELARFHQEIGDFERQLQDRSVRIEALASIREQVRALVPKLTRVAGRSHADALRSDSLAATSVSRPLPAVASAAALTSDDELLGPHFQQLTSVLDLADPGATPRAVTLLREVYPFRLEAREVVAYRRLHDRADCVRELEQFLLEAAALRNRINDEATEIMGILDDTVITRESPVFSRARKTTRLASAFLWRFSHYLEEAIQIGDAQEALNLQVLRMRLMRDFSGLWLLANKP
jgi:hypothetical protein